MPIFIGISIRQRYENWATKVEVYFRRFSFIFMIAMIIGLIIKERELLISSLDQVFFASLSLNVLAVLLGLVIAKITALSFQNAVTLGIEVGIQNGTLALLVAGTILQNAVMTIPAITYSLIMFVTGSVFIFLVKGSQN